MKYATIGSNIITEEFLSIASQIQDFTYKAVYSREQEKAEKFAKKYGVDRVYTDLEMLAKDSEIDMVYIASPNSLHYEQSILMLKNKKNVLCEKPFASNIRQAEEMFEMAEKNGVIIMEAMRPIHDKGYRVLQEQIKKIGQIIKVHLHYSKYSSKYNRFLAGEQTNIFDLKFSGGALMDLGVYPIAFLVGLFGKPEEVQAFALSLSSGVDGASIIIAKYSNMLASLECAKISTSHAECVIEGEKGTIYLPYVRDMETFRIVYHNGEEVEIRRKKGENTFIYEIIDFIEMVKTGKDYKKYKQISLDTISLLDRIRAITGIYFPSDNHIR